MSKWKRFILGTAFVAMLLIVAAAVEITLALCRVAVPNDLQPFVMAGFYCIFPIWAVAVLLSVEFVRVTRKGQSWWARSQGLSPRDLKSLVRWCPRPMLLTALLIACIAAIGLGITGKTHWSGEAFTRHHVIGFSVGVVLFCSIALPVLVSAALMPGVFLDHFGSDRT